MNMCRVLNLPFVASLLVLAMPAVADDEEASIGKLFTDPAKRERMELYRRGEQKKEIVETPSVSNVRVDGVVIRREGDNVIWINGKDTLDHNRFEGIEIHPGAINRQSLEVPVQVDGRMLRIKPGQRWSDNANEVRDSY